MKKLTCLKRDLDESAPQFLLDALVPLKSRWQYCERTPHWADLAKGFNRVVGGCFFEADVDRAATLLERLAESLETDLQNSRLNQDDLKHGHQIITRARQAAERIRHDYALAVLDAPMVDDVDCERFHRREARI